MKLTRLVAVGTMIVALAACTNEQTGQKQTFGTLAGAALGGLLGSQVGSGKGKLAAVGAGVLLGGLLGSEVGKSLDRADQLAMSQSTQRALESQPSGTATTWRNPDSGNSGSITPRPAYQNASGQQCREYQQTVTVGGQDQSAYGTACRQPDGTWKIVSTR